MTTDSAAAPARLLGRRPELAVLDDALVAARAGSGRFVLVEGPPGIGKSALAEAAAARARTIQVEVAWSRCWEDGSAPAYWPWAQVVRQLLPPAEAQAAAAGPLGALLAPAAPAPASGSQDDSRFVLFDAVVGVLARAADARPLLVVLEDLHAADAASLVLLRFVTQQLRRLPCVVVGTSRPTDAAAPGVAAALEEVGRDAERLALAGLQPAELSSLVEDVVHVPASAQLVQALYEATDGNPYHAREVLRLMRAEGGLALQWDSSVPLPPSVGQALLRRLEPLDADVRAVLEAAAVVGRQFDLATLAAVTGRPVDQLLHVLDVAAAHHLVVPTDRVPGTVGFVHALARDAVYGAIPLGRRAELHAAAGEALETSGSAAADELAHHFAAAAALDHGRRGFTHLVSAAEDALARHGYEHAAGLCRQALRLAPIAAPPAGVLGGVHVTLGRALMKAGDLEAGRLEHLAAAQIARREGDAALLAAAALAYGNAPVEGGLVNGTLVGLLEEALDRLGDDDLGVRARLLARLAHELVFSTETSRRQAHSAEALDVIARLEDDVVSAEVLCRVIGASIGPDSSAMCLQLTEQLLAIARRTGAEDLEAEALARRCNWLLELGRGSEFQAAAQRVAELAERLPQPQVRWFAAVLGAVRLAMCGRLEEAAAAIDKAWQDFPTLPNAAGAWAAAGLHSTLVHLGPQLDQWEGLCRSLMQSRPGLRRSWASGLAALLAEAGRRGEAEELLRSLVREIPAMPRDGQYVLTLAWCAHAASVLGSAELAEPLLDALDPFSGRHVYASMALPVAYFGPVDYFLGLLSGTLGRVAEAERRFTAAVAAATQLDAAPWIPLVWISHASLLRAHGEPAEAERATQLLREARASATALGAARVTALAEAALAAAPADPPPSAQEPPALLDEGDWWTITYEGRTTRHRATKGFRYLRLLLEQPGREVHALDLVAAVEGTDRRQVAVQGDAGPLLDERARTEYRVRLEQLRDDIADAEADGDPERAARARAEFQFLTDELQAALGLGGRDRRAGGHAEQARSSVTKLLRRLLARLEPDQPELVRHLRTTLRTGYFCGYGDAGTGLPSWRLR